MTSGDLNRVVTDYAQAAQRAVEAGLDGVEMHGANGYLLDQFMRSTTNRRGDRYGGSPTARARFVSEVVFAVAAQVGEHRVGLRLSPDVDLGDTNDPEICETTLLVADAADRTGIAYLHLVESNNANYLADDQTAGVVDDEFRDAIRKHSSGGIIANPDFVDRLRVCVASTHCAVTDAMTSPIGSPWTGSWTPEVGRNTFTCSCAPGSGCMWAYPQSTRPRAR